MKHHLIAVAAAAVALALPAAASAETLLYVKGGDHSQGGSVMVANPDGSGARVVATPPAGHEYRWPSEADDGTVAVADVKLGPYDPSYSFFAQDMGGTFDLFDQQGDQIRTLPGFPYVSVPWAVITPDGKRIAWAGYDGENRVFWEPTAAGTTGAPGQGQGNLTNQGGQVDRARPVWLDDNTLMLTYTSGVFRLDNEPQYLYYKVGDGADTNYGWFSDWQVDDADPSVGRDYDEFFPAISRNHKTMAIVESQSTTSNNTDPTQPDTWKRILRLFTVNGVPPASTAAPTLRCQISLSGVGDHLERQDASFSPDGTKLALDSNAGIEIADVSDLSADANGNCLHVTPKLAIPGGHEPFWSPAALQPAKPQPIGCGARLRCTHPPTTTKLRLGLARVPRQRLSHLLRHGLKAKAKCTVSCRLGLKLTLSPRTARHYRLISKRRYSKLRHHRHATVTVGHKSKRLRAGKRKAIRVRLSHRAAHRLRHARRLNLRLSATARGHGHKATKSRKVRAKR